MTSDEYRIQQKWFGSVISVGIVHLRGTKIPLEVVFYISSANAYSQLHVAPRKYQETLIHAGFDGASNGSM